MTDGEIWYVVMPVHGYENALHASEFSTWSSGKDLMTVIKRQRLALERSLTERVPGTCWKHYRAGSVFAVWRFSGPTRRSLVMNYLMHRPVWRMYVMTSDEWSGLVELALPSGVTLFDEGEEAA